MPFIRILITVAVGVPWHFGKTGHFLWVAKQEIIKLTLSIQIWTECFEHSAELIYYLYSPIHVLSYCTALAVLLLQRSQLHRKHYLGKDLGWSHGFTSQSASWWASNALWEQQQLLSAFCATSCVRLGHGFLLRLCTEHCP